MPTLHQTIALLHLAPSSGDLVNNRQTLVKAVQAAKKREAQWIITPELCTSGLQFSSRIGTEWIKKQSELWMLNFSQKISSINAVMFLGCPERGEDEKYYNTVFVIDRNGKVVNKQRKLTSYIDKWSTAGDRIVPIQVSSITVGIVICADASIETISEVLRKEDIEMIIAPSSWGPGLYGPQGEWEALSKKSSLPLIVCNRTGKEETLSFWDAESMVIKNGKRCLVHSSRRPAVLTFDWDFQTMELRSSCFTVDYIV